MKDISEKINSITGSVNKYTINEETNLLVEKIQDLISFLIFNFLKYESNYCSGLLLTYPKIWKSLSLIEWGNVLLGCSPRKKMIENDTRLLNEDESYGDIIFLHKYLGINPFPILREVYGADSLDFKSCVKYAMKFCPKFFISEIFLLEDLDDCYSISKDEIDNYSNELISQGGEKGFDNVDEMRNYLKDIDELS